MVTDEEIARGVESLLRQSNPNSFTSLNGVVQQLESKLGLDLSHKATFIRDQISLLLRSNPHPLPQPQLPKDHFALHSHPQYPTPLHPQQFPSHFALHPYHQHPTDPHFQASPPSLQPFPPHAQNQNQNQNHARLQVQAQAQIQSHSRPHPQQPPPAKPEVFAQNAAIVVPEVPKESTPVGAKRRGGPGGLNKVCSVSPELQAIVGEPALPRTEIVKQLWAYIRKNNLQDPSNKRKIICDDALRVVFETDCTDMFKMNKLLAKHIIALEPSKASNQAKKVKVDAEPANTNAETGSSSIVISEALANFLGTGEREMPQAEAIRLVWEYIKVNHLEDPLNTMVILCDPKLNQLLGCESISALGISEMVARHHCIKKS